MKKLIFLLTCFISTLFGQSCVSIQDTLYSIGSVGPITMNGSLLVQLGYFLTDGTYRITQSVTTLNIVLGVLNTCLPPGIYKINYTVKNPNNTPTQYSTYWFIPNNLSGPYQLSSVPAGVVNTSNNSMGSVVSWVSGLDFTNVAVTDTPQINGINYSIASITGVQSLILATNAGAQTGVSFTDGPIERSTVSSPVPPTIIGPTGLSGLPQPPPSGTYCLQSVNGVLGWGAC